MLPSDPDDAAAAKTSANPVLAGGTAGLTAGRRTADASRDDGGLGVVRIKPLGVGASDKGTGTSYSAVNAAPVNYSTETNDLTVGGRLFTYPSHVIAPAMVE